MSIKRLLVSPGMISTFRQSDVVAKLAGGLCEGRSYEVVADMQSGDYLVHLYPIRDEGDPSDQYAVVIGDEVWRVELFRKIASLSPEEKQDKKYGVCWRLGRIQEPLGVQTSKEQLLDFLGMALISIDQDEAKRLWEGFTVSTEFSF